MIWLIGGTKESRVISDELLKKDYKLICTVITDFGYDLIKNKNNLIKVKKVLSFYKMNKFIKNNNIKAIIDASHPYAVNVSTNVIKVSKNLKLPYIRYERKSYLPEKFMIFKSYIESVEYLNNKDGNILLTIGVNNLKYFNKINKERLYVKILPDVDSIKKCRKYGIIINNIIAIFGALSSNFLIEIIKEFNIKYIVTKDSGIIGGVKEKIKATLKENIEIVFIKRPEIKYPEKYDEFKDIYRRVNELGVR